MECVITEAEIFDDGRGPPAPGVQTVGLGDAFCGEVVEIVLHQILNVVAEEDLELRLELASAQLLHLPEAVGGEHLGLHRGQGHIHY